MTDSCSTPDLLSLEQALVKILAELPQPNGYEQVSLKESLDRITYQPVNSTINVPGFRNSSMDGYALHSSDHKVNTLKLVGTSWAGEPYTKEVNNGECVRIFTGAYVPDCCNCVVMQENVSESDALVKINQWPTRYENIRNIADDTSKDQELLTKGTRLKAADIGLLASCGVDNIAVFKRLNVGFFSTGDELRSIGSQLELGQIFDSNRYTLHALLTEAGATPIDMGVIPDNPDDVEKALLSASKYCDVIITSGGVSVGEADFITDVLNKIGRIHLWKIAMKPGKPLVFGSIDNTHFFGLPGNPVSVMINFRQVVLPALKKLMGLKAEQTPLTLQAIASDTILKQPGRIEFQRGIAENIKGALVVKPTGKQGSHMLSSMSKANCFIVLEQNSGDIQEGQLVNIQLLGKSL
ncbi:MAG: molybdopterin molybdenumtransferase MoeA [Cycloclasticus sp. symbiont of Poecilosclerida sp. M]|nr:MAG: molybdopterin molybdenumtransferase MoeA [Cycloclasticus sp. symbiont of Poecilosclerida sp. M]